MKPIVKICLLGTFVFFAGTEITAQEKNTKRKQDSSYLQNKQRSDEQRNRDEEVRRKNDSTRTSNYRDSITQIQRNDSLKYDRTRRDSIHNGNQQRRQDSMDKSQPPMKNGKTPPPKNSAQCAVGSTQLGTK